MIYGIPLEISEFSRKRKSLDVLESDPQRAGCTMNAVHMSMILASNLSGNCSSFLPNWRIWPSVFPGVVIFSVVQQIGLYYIHYYATQNYLQVDGDLIDFTE